MTNLQQLKEENIMGDYYTINPIHRNIKIFKEHALNDFESYYYTNNGVDWSIDEYKTYLVSMIDKAYEEGKEEMKSEILKIELCPTESEIQQISELENKIQAFGYGQGWMLKKIENLN